MILALTVEGKDINFVYGKRCGKNIVKNPQKYFPLSKILITFGVVNTKHYARRTT